MDETQLIAIVAAILASGERNGFDAKEYWEGGKNHETSVRHESFMADCILDAIQLVRSLPGHIMNFDRISTEQAGSDANAFGVAN
jgi:hypothetical protein